MKGLNVLVPVIKLLALVLMTKFHKELSLDMKFYVENMTKRKLILWKGEGPRRAEKEEHERWYRGIVIKVHPMSRLKCDAKLIACSMYIQ